MRGRSTALVAAAVVAVAAAAWWSFPSGRRALKGAWPGKARTPNVLLISIDTLRADHLGSYGYKQAQSPTLDALAARGTRFVNATTVTPLTLPAHASLLTGTFPASHGVRDNGGFYLSDDRLTLAEILHVRGYRTGGFVGAFVLDSRWGINQGFDHYFDKFDISKATGVGMDTIQRPGHEVVDKALEWLAQDRKTPFFAWVHLYDPHAPYEAPPPYRSMFPPTLVGSYDAEIAATDAQVARLLDELRAEERLDDTLVVIVGDHGESLGEHQEQSHGFFIYEATVRIPLILAGPGIAARSVEDQVRIVDVPPTVLQVLGVPIPQVVQGVSLLPVLGGQRVDRLAFAETWYPRYHYGWSELMAVRDGPYKFVLAPHRELYDLRVDPGETKNLAEEMPERAAAAERALKNLLERTTSAAAAKGPERVDPDVEERLRALGYVGGTVSTRTLEDRPRGDPKDKIGLYNLLRLAGQDSVDGRIDEAIAKVRQALAADREIVEGHTMLGNLHVKAGRHVEAVAAYRQALVLDPEHPGAAFSLALAYKNLGRLEDAEAGFGRVLQLDPRSGKSYFQLADIAMRRGDFSKAEQALTTGLTLKVERGPFLVKLGECYIELKRFDDAEKQLRAALAEKPEIERAHYDLGLIHEARGEQDRAIAQYEAELAQNAKNYSASFNLAKLLSAAGRRSEAAARFRQAVSSNPEFGTGYLYLAKALLDSGDLHGAESAARTGLMSKPEAAVAPLGHYVLADVYTRQGRVRDAARQVALARALERRGGE